MPIRKFRDVSEMEEPWRTPGDPALFRAIASVLRIPAMVSIDSGPW